MPEKCLMRMRNLFSIQPCVIWLIGGDPFECTEAALPESNGKMSMLQSSLCFWFLQSCLFNSWSLVFQENLQIIESRDLNQDRVRWVGAILSTVEDEVESEQLWQPGGKHMPKYVEGHVVCGLPHPSCCCVMEGWKIHSLREKSEILSNNNDWGICRNSSISSA